MCAFSTKKSHFLPLTNFQNTQLSLQDKPNQSWVWIFVEISTRATALRVSLRQLHGNSSRNCSFRPSTCVFFTRLRFAPEWSTVPTFARDLDSTFRRGRLRRAVHLIDSPEATKSFEPLQLRKDVA